MPQGRPHEARGDARPRGMISQLREGDFAERQNPAYELLCQRAGEVKTSPAFFLVLPPLDTMRSSNRPTYPYKKMTFAGLTFLVSAPCHSDEWQNAVRMSCQ